MGIHTWAPLVKPHKCGYTVCPQSLNIQLCGSYVFCCAGSVATALPVAAHSYEDANAGNHQVLRIRHQDAAHRDAWWCNMPLAGISTSPITKNNPDYSPEAEGELHRRQESVCLGDSNAERLLLW